jgi:hypothetical protein
LHEVKKSATFQLYPLQHRLQVVPAPHLVRYGQQASVPHAVMALPYQYVAGFRHWLHDVPSPHKVPSAHFATVGGEVGAWVGERDGFTVGCFVGATVGDGVGLFVGLAMGLNVKLKNSFLAVGARVRGTVGVLVGGISAVMGSPVGDTVFFPGCADGISAGVGAGANVTTSSLSGGSPPRRRVFCAPTGTVATASIVATMAATVERRVIFMAGRCLASDF